MEQQAAMLDSVSADRPENDNMQPPPNRIPNEQTIPSQEGDADAPPLAPDNSVSESAVGTTDQSFESIRKLFESVPAEKFAGLFKSQELGQLESAFKSGDRSEIEKLVAASDSQKFYSLLQYAAGSSLKADRSTSIGSDKFLPGIFESRDWASTLAPSHVDVDPAAVFRSEDSIAVAPSVAAIDKATKGTDWNAMYESDLPDVALSASRTAKSSIIEQQKSSGTDWKAVVEGSHLSFPQPVARTTRSSSVEKIKSRSKTSAPVNITKSEQALPTSVLSQQFAQVPRSTSRQQTGSSGKTYVFPTPLDCLLGRGGRTNHNLGNQKYLAAKKDIQPRYLAASKQDKTAISQELVDRVKAWGGRFLELDPVTEKWFEVSATKARKKASQTLRELNTPEERAAKRARYGK